MTNKDLAREAFEEWWETSNLWFARDYDAAERSFIAGHQAATQANKEKLGEVVRTFECLLEDLKELNVYSGDGFASEQKAIAKLKDMIGE